MSNTKCSEIIYDAIVIGAGFSGIQQLHFLRDKLGLNVLLLEAADGVGGTWYWNRYPGARCDSESHSYCFYFSEQILKEWKWSQKYPGQKEILAYLNFVTDKLSLRSNMRFNTRVKQMQYFKSGKTWKVHSTHGDEFRAQYVISAVGCLSSANSPNIEGLDNFSGELYHTCLLYTSPSPRDS